MASTSKFRQYIEDLIYGHEPEQEQKEPEIQPEPEPEPKAQSEDRDWLDEEVEKQQSQQMPDEAYQVSERDEPAPEPLPEQLPEQAPATGEITPGQSDIQHDGLQQDASMDRDTMSDGLDQGGGMDEIEM